MSLEGTLETIALPDVLALLSVTAKTGELRIESGAGVGSVWFDAGRLAGFQVGNQKTVVDALFALLRLTEGSFKFHTGTDALNAMTPEDVVPVLEEAENRLNQWPAIAATIPSLQSGLHLQESVDSTVVLRPDQWQLVTTIAGGRSVVDVLEARQLGEFDGCKALKELVDMRVVWVAVPPPGTVQSMGTFAPSSEEQGAPELAEPPAGPAQWGETENGEVADLSQGWYEPAPAAENAEEPAEEPAPVAEPVNRGLLLKFLGSARN